MLIWRTSGGVEFGTGCRLGGLLERGVVSFYFFGGEGGEEGKGLTI